MSQAPAMPMYWDAYLADTTHLSAEEHGAYMLLMAAMWRRNGYVPDNDVDNARILKVTKAKWKKIKARLDPFLEYTEHGITQKKLQKTWQKTQEIIEKNRANGAKGGRPKSKENNDLGKPNGLVSDNQPGTPPEPEPEPEPNIDTASTGEIGNQPDLNDLNERLLAAIGEAGNQAATGLVNLQRPLAWLQAGCDLEMDILPTIKAVAGRQLQKLGPGCIGTWGYFDNPVMQAKAERLKPLPKMEAANGTGTYQNSRSKGAAPQSSRERMRAALDEPSDEGNVLDLASEEVH